MRALPFLLTGCLVAALHSPAQAAGYVATPIGEPGKYSGCVAVNESTAVGLVGVADTLVLVLNSDLLRTRKGDKIDGTFRVDNGKEMALDAAVSTDNTVTARMPATKEAFNLIANGNNTTATIGATYVEWDLTDSKQGLLALNACMDKNVKP